MFTKKLSVQESHGTKAITILRGKSCTTYSMLPLSISNHLTTCSKMTYIGWHSHTATAAEETKNKIQQKSQQW